MAQRKEQQAECTGGAKHENSQNSMEGVTEPKNHQRTKSNQPLKGARRVGRIRPNLSVNKKLAKPCLRLKRSRWKGPRGVLSKGGGEGKKGKMQEGFLENPGQAMPRKIILSACDGKTQRRRMYQIKTWRATLLAHYGKK